MDKYVCSFRPGLSPPVHHTTTHKIHNPSTMAEPSNGAAAPETQTPIAEDAAAQESTALETTSPKSHTPPHSNRTGWDGKLRVNSEKQAVLANPEALEDSDYEDEDAPPVDQIAADEGEWEWRAIYGRVEHEANMLADLLDEEDPNTEVCVPDVVYLCKA